ncbi:MAG: hemagglutinin repeat-containing protein, partial [Nitrososphaerales archaeon]
LNLASRYTSASLGASGSRTSCDETQAYPNDLEIGELTIISPLWDHGGGAKLKAIRVIAEVDEFLCSPAENRKSMEMHQKNASVGANPMNWGSVSASVGKGRARESHVIRDPASIEADYFFLRTNNAKVSGTILRAKVFDAVVRGSLTLESVLDEIKRSGRQGSFSASYCPALGVPLADGRIANQKDIEKWIAHTCKLIGTQQFYLRVGETFLKRSAQAGLEAEGPEAPKLALMDGGEFYIRNVPGHDHACGFFAMELTRAWGTELLLAHAHDEKLRAMAAVEIYNRALGDNLPDSIRNDARHQRLMSRHNAAFTSRESEAKTAEHKQTLLNYFQEQDVYERYIRFLAESRGFDVPGEMLEFSPGLGGVHAPCVLDGLAYLQKRNLKIYQTNDLGLGELVHEYVYDDPAAETVHLHHTWYDENEQVGFRNHFNRLEPAAESIRAARTVEETIQETHQRRRTKLNVPLASAVALGLEIDKLVRPERYLQTEGLSKEELEAVEKQQQEAKARKERTAAHQAYESLLQEGYSAEEAALIVNHPDIKRILAGKLREQRSKQAPKDEHPKTKKPLLNIDVTAYTLDPLSKALALTEDGALALNRFTHDHPYLAEGGAIALQAALGGPVKMLIDQGIEYIGGDLKRNAQQSIVEMVAEKSHLPESFIEATTEVVGFGISIATGRIKTALKDAKKVSQAVEKRLSRSAVASTPVKKANVQPLKKTSTPPLKTKTQSTPRTPTTKKPVTPSNADSTSTEILRGARNPKVQEALRRGREAHAELKQKVIEKSKKAPSWKSEKPETHKITGQTIIPDVRTPSGRFIELKPNTPSGRKQGARQAKKYEEGLGKKGKIIYYESK